MSDAAESHGLLTDAPIDAPAEDRFGRAPWAHRVAQTIAAQRDPASLVIGIYGPWGDGKTSVLNLIAAEIGTVKDLVPVRFNPWRLGDEAEMLRGFFETLADSLDLELATKKEKAGNALRVYSALLKPIPIAGEAMVGIAGSVGAALSETSLAKQRARIEALLDEQGKRVVVLIDDLDRLDRTEIQAMFRLVKVAADFAHTAYVLCFDHAVVADALAERYAAGAEHGASFMDKIIQLALHLPPAPPEALRRLALEAIESALEQAGIELSEADAAEFVSVFDQAIAPRITTPRIAKRYANALSFALPMIGREVRPVDLMLLEAMRACYPKLYEWVRTHEHDVLGSRTELGGGGDEALETLRTDVDRATAELPAGDAARARSLLTTLFPRTQSAWKNIIWRSEWDDAWTSEKRVASPLYYRRYFGYSLPPGDVADADIDELVSLLTTPDPDPEEIAKLATLFDSTDATKLLPRLASRVPTIAPDAAARLAELIAKHSDRLPTGGGFLGLSPLARATLLVRDLIGRVSPEMRAELAVRLVDETEHLAFAIELIRWLRPSADGPDDGPLDRAEADEAGRVLARRILAVWEEGRGVESFGDALAHSLHVCGIYGSLEALRGALQRQIEGDATLALALMRAFTGGAWSMETGRPLEPEFRAEAYDALAEYVDPDLMFRRFQEQFGPDVGVGEKYSFRALASNERLAQEYAHVHRARSAPPSAEPSSE